MRPLRPIDPVVTFRNSQGDIGRGTLTTVKRRSLMMEIYNPYSIVQVSEVLTELTLRSGEHTVYRGRVVVDSLLNTGLMAVVSVAIIDEWSDLDAARGQPARVSEEAQRFVEDWDSRFRINRSYQVAISEARAFLAETSRWADQADISPALPRDPQRRLREDVFYDLATPLLTRAREYMDRLEEEASLIPAADSIAHRNFAQSALHPLLLRAPFVYRTFAKPMGYAGDYEMVNQILMDPRQGDSTYFQLINTLFLKAAVAEAHRNRITILVEHLEKVAQTAQRQGRPMNVLNVGCGPAVEIQRFIRTHPDPACLRFTLMDFSDETLQYTREQIEAACGQDGKTVNVDYVHESVHALLKRAGRSESGLSDARFDFVYCAGLFDYLSDKVCARLLQYFATRTRPGGRVVVSNVHSANPERNSMEHLLEWHLIYRDEAQLESLLPTPREATRLYTDVTGVNVFAEFCVPAGGARAA